MTRSSATVLVGATERHNPIALLIGIRHCQAARGFNPRERFTGLDSEQIRAHAAIMDDLPIPARQ
jgi:hypothetical protein